MSQLTIYNEADADKPTLVTEDVAVIISELGAAGIRVERWQADRDQAVHRPGGVGRELHGRRDRQPFPAAGELQRSAATATCCGYAMRYAVT